MTYTYLPNEGDTATFFIHEVEGDKIYSTWNAKRVNFSNDSEWLAFLVDPTEKEAKALKKQEKPVTSSLHLYHLSSQTVDTIRDVQAYRFSEASNYMAIKKTKSDPDAKHEGTDLIIKDLDAGVSTNIGNVSDFGFNEQGGLLAYIIDADGNNGNGIYVKYLAKHRTWPLHTGMDTYRQLSWNEAGDQLAVLFGDIPKGKIQHEMPLGCRAAERG